MDIGGSIEEGCICHGNWRNIVKDNEARIGRRYQDRHGNTCRFFGLVHSGDDYYYGMTNCNNGKLTLLSCVGSIEGFGYELIPIPSDLNPAHPQDSQSAK